MPAALRSASQRVSTAVGPKQAINVSATVRVSACAVCPAPAAVGVLPLGCEVVVGMGVGVDSFSGVNGAVVAGVARSTGDDVYDGSGVAIADEDEDEDDDDVDRAGGSALDAGASSVYGGGGSVVGEGGALDMVCGNAASVLCRVGTDATVAVSCLEHARGGVL